MLSSSSNPSEALGESEAFLQFQERLSQVAPVERPALIIGERGSGKELAASRLHFLSQRWGKPFVALNCAALSPSVLESELFGHEAGSFTGAASRRKGRFEAANGGTLFLDEIGQIPMLVQEKILRVVEYGAFERVGSSTPIQVDVRIVGATNADLPELARKGKFKRDLLDRLSFEVLPLPPLRDRAEDIPLLANRFAVSMASELCLDHTPEFSENALQALLDYHWPGNIRELKNVVERAVYRNQGKVIDWIQFDPFDSPYLRNLETHPEMHLSEEHETGTNSVEGASRDSSKSSGASAEKSKGPRSIEAAVRELELRMLQEAMGRNRHVQKKAAEDLGLTYHQFRGLYRKYQDELRGSDH